MKTPKWSALSTKILAGMSAITIVLGFLTVDQLNNPPVFSVSANILTDASAQEVLEIELSALAEHSLRDARISFFLMDADEQRIALVTSTDGRQDHFAPVDMLIAANQSKFAMLGAEDMRSGRLDTIDMLYVCATFRGRIFGTSHQQTYLMTRRGKTFSQRDDDRGFGVFGRPECGAFTLDGVEITPLASPDDFD